MINSYIYLKSNVVFKNMLEWMQLCSKKFDPILFQSDFFSAGKDASVLDIKYPSMNYGISLE